MHTRAALVRIALIFSLILNALPAWAAGGRDATFGSLGELRLSPGVSISTAVEQPDGKVLLAGYTNVANAPIDLCRGACARERLAGPRVWRGGHSENRHRRGKRPCHGDCAAIGRSDYRCRMFFAPTPCGSVRQQPESRLNGDGTRDLLIWGQRPRHRPYRAGFRNQSHCRAGG